LLCFVAIPNLLFGWLRLRYYQTQLSGRFGVFGLFVNGLALVLCLTRVTARLALQSSDGWLAIFSTEFVLNFDVIHPICIR
jgi:hypothetical protein